MNDMGANHPKYVLNINGHSHDYERTYPQSGVVHITTGNGGASLEQDGSCKWLSGCPPPSYSAFRAMHHGVLKLHFGPDSIEGWEICGVAASSDDIACTTGSTLDHFVIGTRADLAPIVSAPVKVDGVVGKSIDFRVTARDPDGDPVVALSPDLSGLPSGDATWTPDTGGASGSFHWQPAVTDLGTFTVTFTAHNVLTGAASTVLAVQDATLPVNLILNASFDSSTAGWSAYGGSALARVSPGLLGDWCAEITGSPTTVTRFGLTDAPNWIARVGATGEDYRFSAWVRSVNATGSARLRAREYLGTILQGTEDLSAPTVVTSDWQRLEVEHLAITPGSTIDFHVLYDPTGPGESFQVDSAMSVMIPPAVAQGAAAHAPPLSDAGLGPLRFSTSVRPIPVVGRAVLSFALTRPGPVEIMVFGIDGRRVATLLDQPFVEAGRHEIAVDPRSARLAPGVYHYRVRAAEGALTGRFVIL